MSKINNDIINFLEAGLKAENLKQKVISNNVANLQTRGYKTVDVKFEDLLSKAMKSGKDFNIKDIEAELYKPQNTPVKANDNDVSLENEVGKMVKNTLRHKTYVRILAKKYSQMELAINTK